MDLVVVAISGVQRFIAEARSTADLRAGSGLMSGLADAAISVVPNPTMLILPAGRTGLGGGTPNRVVALAEDGTGPELAGAMAKAARAKWDEWLERTFADNGSPVPRTPGFPHLQWATVPIGEKGYQDAWHRVQATLAARRRIRNFPPYFVDQAVVCSLTGRWPAVPGEEAPKTAYNTRRGEALSAVGHVKRYYGRRRGGGFPSTWSIASAPYRDAIIRRGEDFVELWDAVARLNAAVEALWERGGEATRTRLRHGSGSLPGLTATSDPAMSWLREVEGAWCAPETWEPTGLRRDHNLATDPDKEMCDQGAGAASALARVARQAKIPALTPYLAVLAQDADRMGEQLSDFPADGSDPASWHKQVSAALGEAAQKQVREIESAHLGRVVYAGGDDLLAMVPAGRAVAAARAVNKLFTDDDQLKITLDRPSASTAIVVFHASWPLQSAVAAAQALLKQAKERRRPGLGIAVLTRGGERARVILPWLDRAGPLGTAMIDYLEELVAATMGPLSGRLAAGLEADREGLASLSRVWLERELGRRAARHGISPEHAEAIGQRLAALCGATPGEEGFIDCAQSVLVARFLAGLERVPT